MGKGRRFKKDIDFDAAMVIAVRKNLLEPFAMQSGLKPDEIFARRDWLPKQSTQYLHAVELKVRVLEQKAIADSLSDEK